MTPRSRPWWAMHHWSIWSLPATLMAFVLSVDLGTLALLGAEGAATPRTAIAGSAVTAVALTACSIIHSELSTRIERVRRRIGLEFIQVNLTSVWTFAAALLLPPVIASTTVVALYAFLYFRVWRAAKSPFYRHVFSACTVILAVHAGAAINFVLGGGSPGSTSGSIGLLSVAAALVVYTVVNATLVMTAVAVSTKKRFRELVGSGDEIVVETATLCLGALVALAVNAGGVWLIALALPPMFVLHRAVLARKLQETVDTDGKTGLLTAAAWQKHAMQLVGRARTSGRAAAVLILDLDHFKRVNDTHGHLAGDAVLAAVAGKLRSEVREQDQVGRFGGEEFLILLPGAHDDLRRIAERIRSSVAGLAVEIPTADGPLTIEGLSVSIGGARFPEDGGDVPALVAVADAALYDAKHSGRNAVRLGRPTRPHPTDVPRPDPDRHPPTAG